MSSSSSESPDSAPEARAASPADKLISRWNRRLRERRDPFPIWNVPYRPNPGFVGHRDLLQAIRGELQSGRPVVLTQARRDLGAVGKTQVALRYACLHRRRYRIVWWMRGSDPGVMASDYMALALALGLPERGAPPQWQQRRALQGFLAQSLPALLVFDDVTEPVVLPAFLPPEGAVHVLITSRRGEWSEDKHVHVVSPQPEEAVRILVRKSGLRRRQGADELAQALGHAPLAAELAGTFLRYCNVGYRKMAKFMAQPGLLVPRYEDDSADYRDGEALAWSVIFDQLCDEKPAAAALLNLCSFLGPEEVPYDLFHPANLAAGAGARRKDQDGPVGPDVMLLLAATVGSEPELLRHLALLDVCALSQLGAGGFHVPRSTQTIARDRLSYEDERIWIEALLRLLSEQLVRDAQPGGRARRLALYPHILSAARHAERLEVQPAQVLELLRLFSRRLQQDRLHMQSGDVVIRAYGLAARSFGLMSLPAALCLGELGVALMYMGRAREAQFPMERALEISEHILGKDHPRLAYPLANLASVLAANGEFGPAHSHLTRALELFRASLGEKHPLTTRIKNFMATLRRSDA